MTTHWLPPTRDLTSLDLRLPFWRRSATIPVRALVPTTVHLARFVQPVADRVVDRLPDVGSVNSDRHFSGNSGRSELTPFGAHTRCRKQRGRDHRHAQAEDDEWMYEVKFDGYRAPLLKDSN